MTVKEALDAVESTLGSNALKLPTSETFAKYRVISGTGGNKPDPTPTPSSDPDNTPVPDTGYKDPFTYIQDVLVSSTLLSAMAGILQICMPKGGRRGSGRLLYWVRIFRFCF